MSEFQRYPKLAEKKKVIIVAGNDQRGLVKRDFKVLPNESARNAGNRCIFLLDSKKKRIDILLVYHKDHLGKGNETNEWKRIIKKSYPHLAKEFNLD